MSRVTGLVLTVSVCEPDETIEDMPDSVLALNRWLGERSLLPLAEVTAGLVGAKHPQLFAFGRGYNHFDEDAFAAAFLAQPWTHPENAVLVMQPEEGPTRVFRPAEPKAVVP